MQDEKWNRNCRRFMVGELAGPDEMVSVFYTYRPIHRLTVLICIYRVGQKSEATNSWP